MVCNETHLSIGASWFIYPDVWASRRQRQAHTHPGSLPCARFVATWCFWRFCQGFGPGSQKKWNTEQSTCRCYTERNQSQKKWNIDVWYDGMIFVVPSLRTTAVQSPTIQNTLMNLVANLLAMWGQSRRRNGLVVRPLATSLSCRQRWLVMRATWNKWKLCCGRVWP